MPSFAASSLFLDRFVHLIVGAMEEIDPKREPLLTSSSKPLPFARYALGVALSLDIAAMLALGCWLFARSPALTEPSVAFNESLVLILSGISLAFAYAFYLGAGPTARRGPLVTLTSAYTPVDFWLLAAAVLTIAAGFVLLFLHRGFRDGERAVVGGIYQILLHSAGVLIISLPGYSAASAPESCDREIPSAVLLGSWMVVAICFGLIQFTCAYHNYMRHH